MMKQELNLGRVYVQGRLAAFTQKILEYKLVEVEKSKEGVGYLITFRLISDPIMIALMSNTTQGAVKDCAQNQARVLAAMLSNIPKKHFKYVPRYEDHFLVLEILHPMFDPDKFLENYNKLAARQAG
jgi:hypothetical protein